MSVSRAKTLQQGRRVRGPARLIVLAGPQAGRRCELPEQCVLGRAVGSPIVLEDPGVSRRHVEIRKRADGGWELEDLGSQNGVRLNGVPITKSELFIGDKLQLGPNVLLLFTDRGEVEGELLEKQKLEVVGRVAVGVAHDFNNVLNVLAASAALLKDGDAREREAAIHDIDAAIAKGARLANRLVGFARGAQEGRSTVDVAKVCREIAHLAGRFAGTSVRFETDLEAGLNVVADAGELEQVFMNLCVNARDAMPQGGVVTIRGRRILLDKLVDSDLPESTPYVHVAVRDTGSGIAPAHLGRIFEPFFTTKASGAGFGVGLATVREIVSLHAGAIAVESDVGRGTTFNVYLPATDTGDTSLEHTPRPPPSLTGQGRRAMIVDDDMLVRRSMGRLMRRMGFDVVEAANGDEALALYPEGTPPFFVVLDLEMPGMDGLDVLQQLRVMDPRARVLVSSGYRDPAKEAAVRARGGVFLGKPFTAADLTTALRTLAAAEAQSDDLPTIETAPLGRR